MLSAISRFFARHGTWVNTAVTLAGILVGGSLPNIHLGDIYVEYYEASVPVDIQPVYESPNETGPLHYFSLDHKTTQEDYTVHPTRWKGIYGHVFVLSDDFCWLYEADGGDETESQVELVGRPQDSQVIPRFLRQQALQGQLRLATDVIAVGVASCEGDQDSEYKRAGLRSDKLMYWLRTVKPYEDAEPRLHRLNIGQYLGCPEGATPETTRRQRPVLFVALIRTEGQQMGPHDMMKVLENAEELDIDLERYSHFLGATS